MGRYIVDIRTGCAAVRDTHHSSYEHEGNGLHSDFGSVVEYVAYYNNHKGDGGDFEEQDERIKVKFLEDICSLLNFKHQTETPEEKEAFDSMANDSELPNGSEWDGEGLPPVGVECEVKFTTDTNPKWYRCVVEYVACDVGVVDIDGCKVAFTALQSNGHSAKFRKPETPQQREERERLEAAYDLYLTQCLTGECDQFTYEEFIKEEFLVKIWLSIVDKTGYRKAK